jgi:hypothetical protein
MELVVEFVLWIMQIAFWYMIFTAVFNLIRLKFYQPRDQELVRIINDLESEQLIPLLVELDQNTYFCYNCLTEEFVCQGQDAKEILTRFKQRFPGRYCSLSQGPAEVLDVLKQQLKEFNESSSSIRSPS